MINKAKNIAVAYAAIIAWMFIVVYFFKVVQPGSINIQFLFGLLIFAPFLENAVFQYGALEIAKKLDIVTPVCIISSFVFGALHGFREFNILLQGGYGLIFCWIYLKEGYLSSVIVHFLLNLTVLAIQYNQ